MNDYTPSFECWTELAAALLRGHNIYLERLQKLAISAKIHLNWEVIRSAAEMKYS